MIVSDGGLVQQRHGEPPAEELILVLWHEDGKAILVQCRERGSLIGRPYPRVLGLVIATRTRIIDLSALPGRAIGIGVARPGGGAGAFELGGESLDDVGAAPSVEAVAWAWALGLFVEASGLALGVEPVILSARDAADAEENITFSVSRNAAGQLLRVRPARKRDKMGRAQITRGVMDASRSGGGALTRRTVAQSRDSGPSSCRARTEYMITSLMPSNFENSSI